MTWRDATARRAGRGDAASPHLAVVRLPDRRPPETRGSARRDHPAFAGSTAGAPGPTIGACSPRPTPRSPRRSPAPSCSPATPAGTTPARRFNLLLDQHPAAVAFPADAQDVAAAVAYARAAGLRVAPQATAHNQGPLGDLEDTLLLNVSALQEVRVDPGARRVRVGAGVKWDRVAPRLSAHGLAGPARLVAGRRHRRATRSAAAWAGWPASTACRPTP